MYIYMYIYTYTKFDSLSLSSHFVLFYFILFYVIQIISTIYAALFPCRLALSVVSFLIFCYICFILLYGGFLFYTCRRPYSQSDSLFLLSHFQFILIFYLILLFYYFIVCFPFFLNLGGLFPSSTRSRCRLPRLFMMFSTMAGRQRVAAYCSVMHCLQCVAVCCSVSQCVAFCCGVLQCVAVCCSVLQCVAVCCSVLLLHDGW